MISCMLCNAATASVFCYNDNAYLCKNCDCQIHNKNKLAWRHQRVHLCEVCDATPKPAVVYCAQDTAYLCRTCDGNVHAANSIASGHDRSPVASFTEEQRVSGGAGSGSGMGEGTGDASGLCGDDGDDDSDRLFSDLLNNHGDGGVVDGHDGHDVVFHGLPEMDTGDGFLVDDPNGLVGTGIGVNESSPAVKRETDGYDAYRGPPRNVESAQAHDFKRESVSPRETQRDSSGSASGAKICGGESGADGGREQRGNGTQGSGSFQPRTHAAEGDFTEIKNNTGIGSGSFQLSMDDYASLERVGNVDVDDFLGPIMDDQAVGFDDGPNGWARGMNGGGHGGDQFMRQHASGNQPGTQPGLAGGSSQAVAQARAQQDARALAMHNVRAQGVGAGGGAHGGSTGNLMGMGGQHGLLGCSGNLGDLGGGGASGSGAGGEGSGSGRYEGMGNLGGPRGPGGPGGMPLPAAAPGTHGMPPPLFGQPGVGGGGTGGGPPGGPGSIPRGGAPNGMLFFSGPPLPMLHLANGTGGVNAPPSRLERLRRWKEKRKNRNFNKTIRYQSRKMCADNRPRVKGKFVKVGSTPDLGAMDDLGADFERARSVKLQRLPEEDTEHSLESEDSGSRGDDAATPGRLASTSGLRRTGGLTASMSVPAGLAMMGGGGGSES